MSTRFSILASRPCLYCGLLVIFLALTNGSAYGQSEAADADAPKIEIVKAVFGSGRAAVDCTAKIKQLFQQKDVITTISTPGLGLKNRSGRFRDGLRVWVRVNGKAYHDEKGNEVHYWARNAEKIDIRKGIIELADQWIKKDLAKMQESIENAQGVEPRTSGEPIPRERTVAGSEDGANSIERAEFADKVKPFERNLSTVQGLLIQEQQDGQQFGITVDIIAQSTPSRDYTPLDFQRRKDVGKQMIISMEEAGRAVRARYPQWEKNKIVRLSFGDKYTAKDGGSSGAAFALLVLSLLEGFEIDPDLAITGDILANWKIVSAGAVPEKIRSAVVDNKKIVAIPAQNTENVNDTVVQFSLDHAWRLQIFSVPDLHSLIEISRMDRSDSLTEAIRNFVKIQERLRSGGESVLSASGIQEELEAIIALAPNHESAKTLLAASKGSLAARLTRDESLRKLSILMKPLDDVLWAEPSASQRTISSARIDGLLKKNEQLLAICHLDIRSLIDQFDRYLKSLKRLVDDPNQRRLDTFEKERAELVNQFQEISVNREFMESLIRN